MRFLRKILCVLGMHGPNFYGNESCDASERGPSHRNGFVRTCTYCGKVWYGAQIETRRYRTLGDWKTEAELRASGEWVDEHM